MAEATAALGHVDVLVANHARSSRQSLAELTAAELDLSFAVNARASLLLARHLADQHDGRVGGRVVLFTSGQYHGAMPDELPYIASKAVVQQLTASLAVTRGPRAITVNCVNPGPNDTGYATGELRRGRGCDTGPAVGSAGRHRAAGGVAVQRRGRLGHRADHRLRRRMVRAWRPALSR